MATPLIDCHPFLPQISQHFAAQFMTDLWQNWNLHPQISNCRIPGHQNVPDNGFK